MEPPVFRTMRDLIIIFHCILGPCRLTRGPDAKKNAQFYLQRARISIVHHAAAVAWSSGVPWATALDLSKKAIATADGRPKALPKERPRRV